MYLSIIIPAYNEAKRITNTISEIQNYFKKGAPDFEVLVVNDGSTDNTAEVVKDFAKQFPQLRLISLPHNKGKGFAVKSGAMESTGELILFTDADGSTPIAELERLNVALNSSDADIAIGSRALKSDKTKIKARLSRVIVGRIFNFAVNCIAVPGIRDTQCGFKLFRRRVINELFEQQHFKRFSFDIELLRVARVKGFKVVEVPVNWHHVSGSKVSVVSDGLKMLIDTIKIRIMHP